MKGARARSAVSQPGAETRQPAPTVSFGALFSCALTVLSLFWLPLVLLQQIDALLVFASPAEIWRDIALLMLLATIPAALLATIGMTVGTISQRAFPARGVAKRLAWALVLVPIFWLFLWQLARAAWLWLKLVTGHQIALTPALKLAAIFILLTALALAWKRWGSIAIVTALLDRLHSLRRVTLLVLLASALYLGWQRPQLLVPNFGNLGTVVDIAKSRPDIFLISLDALAAQDALVCGTGPTTMPRLREFASQASCFSRLYASSNYTTPTTSTMETGTLPWSHFATQISAKVGAPLQDHTVSNALRRVGYRTHTITDNQLASPRHHGTYRGYDDHTISSSNLLRDKLRAALTIIPDSSLPLLVDSGLSFLGAFDTYLHRDRNPFVAERVYAKALAMLDHAAPGQSQFLWVHTMPPHSPYLPPPNTKYKLLPPGELDHWHQFLEENIAYPEATQPIVDKHRLRYQESIMAADASLGEFLDELNRRGRLKNALIIITADHGESFERGFLGHAGPMLHDALIHIPLAVKLPGQTQGRVINTAVGQADLASTLLEFAGAPALPHAEGRSLMPSLKGELMVDAPVFSMTLERQSRYRPLASGNFAVIEGKYKYIKYLAKNQPELYDLDADPKEQVNLAARHPEISERLERLISAQLGAAEAHRKQRFAQ